MKILWHTIQQKLVKYPRDDDAEVIGLDAVYDVYELINADKPDFDSETQYLSPSQTIDHEAKTVTRGWSAQMIETPPLVVSMTSLRLALIDAGLYQTITAAINGITDATERLKAQTWWTTAATVRRDHPLVAGIAALAGQTDAQVDAIFAAAQALDNPTP